MINWKLERKKIKDLHKYPKNPRSLTKEQFRHLKNSLDKFGLIDKPIINLDGTIIGGHQRIEVLKKKGEKEIECWIPDTELSNRDVEELNLRLNRNSGSWDWETLANEFEIPDLIEWGFSEDEVFAQSEEDEKPEKKKKKEEPEVCPHCGGEL